jgi:flagellar M-ring protein FliF
MTNLPKTLARLIVFARSMTPQSRMVVGLLLLLIAIGGVYMLSASVSDDRVQLLGDAPIAPNQIISMQVALAQAGLNEATVEDGFILIPREQKSQYLAALADAGTLPHNFGDTLRKMLESNSLLINKKRQEDLLKFGMQKELSELVSRLKGIEWATVMYEVQPASFHNQKREVRVCVTVKPRGDGPLPAERKQQIRSIVGPPLLALPEDITVVDTQAAAYPAETAEDVNSPEQELHAATQRIYERQYKEKIDAALHFVPGAIVTLSIELHNKIEEPTHTVKIDAKAGHELGGTNSPAAIGLSDNNSETHPAKRAKFTPNRVIISVAVPRNYFEQQWQVRSKSSSSSKPNSTEFAKIEEQIRGELKQQILQVLPTLESFSSELHSLITVTSLPATSPAEVAQVSRTDRALVWLSEHSVLVIAVVSGFIGLLMLRSIVRLAVRNRVANSEPSRHEAYDQPHKLPRPPAYTRTRRRGSVGSEARNELNEVVRDDPGAAARVLRHWIASTS